MQEPVQHGSQFYVGLTPFGKSRFGGYSLMRRLTPLEVVLRRVQRHGLSLRWPRYCTLALAFFNSPSYRISLQRRLSGRSESPPEPPVVKAVESARLLIPPSGKNPTVVAP